MKIAVAGAGYVGLSLAVLLARKNQVCIVDISEKKIDMLKQGLSPIKDCDIERFLAHGSLDLTPTVDGPQAYSAADYVLIATPTNYDEEVGSFDTRHVEDVVDLVLKVNPEAVMVIKSTVPVGFTQTLCERYPQGKFLFSPEFLREGKALHDNLHPSRIIVGVPSGFSFEGEIGQAAFRFANALVEASEEDSDTIPVLLMRATEAEAVKLFSNTYLALRVSFFNELDTYASVRGLDAGRIILGVGYDPRIGNHYNNPSFGYGGYCLPKDTKQLLANYRDVPQNLIEAIAEANSTRKDFIAQQILLRVEKLREEGVQMPLVGVFRLVMKTGSDNLRDSSVLGVMERLRPSNVPVLVYEPTLSSGEYSGWNITDDLCSFKQRCDIIVANRWDVSLSDVRGKVFTRDAFGRD